MRLRLAHWTQLWTYSTNQNEKNEAKSYFTKIFAVSTCRNQQWLCRIFVPNFYAVEVLHDFTLRDPCDIWSCDALSHDECDNRHHFCSSPDALSLISSHLKKIQSRVRVIGSRCQLQKTKTSKNAKSYLSKNTSLHWALLGGERSTTARWHYGARCNSLGRRWLAVLLLNLQPLIPPWLTLCVLITRQCVAWWLHLLARSHFVQ